MNIRDEIEAWQGNLQRRGGNTAHTYRSASNKLLTFLDERGIRLVEQLSPVVFTAFVVWLSDQPLSSSTKQLYQVGVKSFWNWLVIRDQMACSYADELKYRKAVKNFSKRNEKPLERTPRPGNAETIVRCAEGLSFDDGSRLALVSLRNEALVKCLYSSGCRISELLSLRYADLEENRVLVMGKGQKERYVFFDDAAVDALTRYHAHLPDGAPLFCRHDRAVGEKIETISATTARAVIRELRDECSVKGVFTPHSFRHNFGIRVLHETGNLALTQDLMGHSDPKSTRHYAKISVDDLENGHSAVFNTR